MKILSRIYNFFFSSKTEGDAFAATEQEIEKATRIADEMAETEEEENTETCEICGKVFTGEHAGQKKGGHKASAHYR